MKKILVMITILGGGYLSAQNSKTDVPASVRSAFETLYAGAEPSWEKERYGLYEAEFLLKGKRASATFNANGKLQRLEEIVPEKEIPGDVIKHTHELYPGSTVEECAKISTPDDKEMFEVEILDGKKRRSLIFDRNNNYLRQEVDEDDDDLRKNKKKSTTR